MSCGAPTGARSPARRTDVRSKLASRGSRQDRHLLMGSFSTISAALDEIARGRMVVVVDDEDRENEGDLVMAAEPVTSEAINFMATYARGLICLTLTPEQCGRLGLEMMAFRNASSHQTPFTVTIEARDGVTDGLSASDRA